MIVHPMLPIVHPDIPIFSIARVAGGGTEVELVRVHRLSTMVERYEPDERLTVVGAAAAALVQQANAVEELCFALLREEGRTEMAPCLYNRDIDGFVFVGEPA